MFGDFQEKQEELQKVLKNKKVNISVEGGLIEVQANAARVIENIKIDPSILDDAEAIEDLLLVAMNKTMAQIAEVEAAETQKLMSSMMPGLGDIGKLFG